MQVSHNSHGWLEQREEQRTERNGLSNVSNSGQKGLSGYAERSYEKILSNILLLACFTAIVNLTL
jgi:hypothetical protein